VWRGGRLLGGESGKGEAMKGRERAREWHRERWREAKTQREGYTYEISRVGVLEGRTK
jgi:hypothetical protein